MNGVLMIAPQSEPSSARKMPPELDQILKQVSRSFYLTLSVLPAAMRLPVSIAYLIARAADAVADTSARSGNTKIEYLQKIQTAITDCGPCPVLDGLLESVDHAGERRLLEQFADVFLLYLSLPPWIRQEVGDVCRTLINGMLFDQQFFEQDSMRQLETLKDLDRYTYQVAGCVGEFWTKVSVHAGVKFRGGMDENLLARGVALGKALQHTNIIRDIYEDSRIGRTYMPRSLLQQHDLALADFMKLSAPDKNNQIRHEWLSIVLAHYSDGIDYLMQIPAGQYRLRLAVALPLVIGLHTLQCVVSAPFPNRGEVTKVRRVRIYQVLLTLLLVSGVSMILRAYINRLYRQTCGLVSRSS